jgi:hypothetical protein
MYTVTFTDGTTFEGGSPNESLWDKIPAKPIRSIEYALTPFLKYLFKDFECYNHCVERVRGVNKGVEKITKVIIMGMTAKRVYQIMMDDKGGVYQLVTEIGKEYSPYSKYLDGKFLGWGNGKPLAGWRPGVPLCDENQPKLTKVFCKSDVEETC